MEQTSVVVQHRCRAPVLHGLAACLLPAVWIWWSWSVLFTVGLWLVMLVAPARQPMTLGKLGLFAGLGLLRWGIDLLWLLGIPAGAIWLLDLGLTLPGCTQRIPRPGGSSPTRLQPSSQPVLVERVYLAEPDAIRRGFPGPVLVERAHDREDAR